MIISLVKNTFHRSRIESRLMVPRWPCDGLFRNEKVAGASSGLAPVHSFELITYPRTREPSEGNLTFDIGGNHQGAL